MEEKNIYTVSYDYHFEGAEDGQTIALFEILNELKKLNKILKEKL